jgi:peptidoglycan/LPS O-acetylase OafA/YrhL
MSAPAGTQIAQRPTQSHGLARIPALDGLRAIAVAAVLLFHTGNSPLAGGYLGVDLFFVLSGFLITGILLAEAGRDGRIALGAFWLRRARRLAPPLLLLLLVLGVVRLFLPPSLGDTWRADIVAALTYTTNWWEIVQSGDYFAQFGPESPVLHTWSLAIEEQFYLLFAVFMAIVARRRIQRRSLLLLLLVGTAGSIATMYWATTSGNLTWAYYATVPRLQALLIGAMLAVLLRGGPGPAVLAKWRDPVGVAGLAGLAVLLAGVWPASFGWTYTVVALCAAAVIWAVVGPSRLAGALAWRPLVALGLFSYGVYLWHWPIFLWLQGRDASVLAQLTAAALTVLIAAASYLMVEQPIRRGRFVRLPPGVQWASYAAVCASLVLLVLTPTRGSEPQIPLLSDEPLAALSDTQEGERSRGAAPARLSREWPSDRHVPSRILVNGDSSMLALTMRFPHDRYPGRTVTGATLLGCGVSSLPYSPTGGVLPPPPECERWRDEWRAQGSSLGGQVAVTSVSGWDTINRKSEGELVVPGDLAFDRAFAVAFEDGLQIASRDGEIPVYVLGMPCFAARNDGLLRNDPLRRAQLNMLAQLVVERTPRAHFVDLDPLTCDEEVGVSKDRAKALYVDGVHWSPQGGRVVWAMLMQRWRQDRLMDAANRP